MLSLRQRLLNLNVRFVQKTALALVTNPTLARLMARFNAWLLYKRPKGLWTRPLDLGTTQCGVDDLPSYGTIFYIHGGGFVLGDLTVYRHLVAILARDTRMRGVFVSYPLAPEHPAPAALDAVTKAYLARAADGDCGPIAIVGDSAGGNLALALLHRIIALGLPRPCAVAVIAPVTDFTAASPSLTTNARSELLIPAAWARRIHTQYLAGSDPTDPELSPLFGEYEGAPPVLLHVDTTESLYDDARRMADRLRAQGVDVTLHETTGEPHVNHLNVGRTPEATAAVTRLSDFLNAHRP